MPAIDYMTVFVGFAFTCLTINSFISSCANACVEVYSISAYSAITTWIGRAFVDIWKA